MLFWAAFAALAAIRVPSLAQPAGGDQGLYWYIGQRIAQGEIPYRDAWDQKPPGVHFTYAALMWLWPHESAVPAADFAVAVAIALLLLSIGRHLSPASGAGETSALIFLALSNPVVTRLGGVRVRAQSETFIALAVAAAVFALRHRLPPARNDSDSGMLSFFAAGLAIGAAIVFKYNAAVYIAIPLFVWVVENKASGNEKRVTAHSTRLLLALAAGCAIPILMTAIYFAAHGAWSDLLAATISYNVLYSGETYSGAGDFLRYLFTFPYRHAWIDSLWFLGGTGCAVLAVIGLRSARLLAAPLWVAAACLSITINGSRDLQQYFVQAGPALALAAGIAGALAWARLPVLGRVVLVALVGIAIWRITDIPKGIEYTRYDWHGMNHTLPRDEYLSRFGAEGSGDKYSALAVERLARYLTTHTAPDDRVFVFGFSGASYAKAQRASASRFFWSRPVIVEFNRGHAGYGPEGLLAELSARQPATVVLQWRDWDPDTIDSATYFHRTSLLDNWLRNGYEETERLGNYEIWLRKSATQRSTSGPGTTR